LEAAPVPVATGPVAALASPLWPMTGLRDASSAPKTLLHRWHVIAQGKGSHHKKCPAGHYPPHDPLLQ
jgi:hypothetical protein